MALKWYHVNSVGGILRRLDAGPGIRRAGLGNGLSTCTLAGRGPLAKLPGVVLLGIICELPGIAE